MSPLPARVGTADISSAFSPEVLARLQAAGVTGLTRHQRIGPAGSPQSPEAALSPPPEAVLSPPEAVLSPPEAVLSPPEAFLTLPELNCLPLPEALQELFPSGMRRGWTLTVNGSSSLILALLAPTSQRQGWCAEVGSPLVGSTAAAEAGIVLERFVRIAQPGEQWPTVVASLLEAFDLVVVHPPPGRVGAADMRRLSARAREQGAVLIVTGTWEGAMVGLSITRQRWHGLGGGHGYLQAREVEIQALGRGAAVRPRLTRVWLPASDGGLSPQRHAA